MGTDDWTPLPPLWPMPAASRTIGEYELLVFTQEGVPTWKFVMMCGNPGAQLRLNRKWYCRHLQRCKSRGLT